jgi:hypothetical protein
MILLPITDYCHVLETNVVQFCATAVFIVFVVKFSFTHIWETWHDRAGRASTNQKKQNAKRRRRIAKGKTHSNPRRGGTNEGT